MVLRMESTFFLAPPKQQVLGLVKRDDPRVPLHRRRALLVLQRHALLAQQVEPFHLPLSRHIWVRPRHGHTWPLGCTSRPNTVAFKGRCDLDNVLLTDADFDLTG